MNMATVWVLVGLTILEVVYRLADLIYRIVTENDYVESWKERAVGDLVAFILLNLLKYMFLFEGIKFAGTYKSVYGYYYCSKCGIYVRKDIVKRTVWGDLYVHAAASS